MAGAQAHSIRHMLIQPGRPMQNGCFKSFNGKSREGRLNECLFQNLHQARMAVAFCARTTTKSGRTTAWDAR